MHRAAGRGQRPRHEIYLLSSSHRCSTSAVFSAPVYFRLSIISVFSLMCGTRPARPIVLQADESFVRKGASAGFLVLVMGAVGVHPCRRPTGSDRPLTTFAVISTVNVGSHSP